jgi:hypothetical protein
MGIAGPQFPSWIRVCDEYKQCKKPFQNPPWENGDRTQWATNEKNGHCVQVDHIFFGEQRKRASYSITLGRCISIPKDAPSEPVGLLVGIHLIKDLVTIVMQYYGFVPPPGRLYGYSCRLKATTLDTRVDREYSAGFVSMEFSWDRVLSFSDTQTVHAFNWDSGQAIPPLPVYARIHDRITNKIVMEKIGEKGEVWKPMDLERYVFAASEARRAVNLSFLGNVQSFIHTPSSFLSGIRLCFCLHSRSETRRRRNRKRQENTALEAL